VQLEQEGKFRKQAVCLAAKSLTKTHETRLLGASLGVTLSLGAISGCQVAAYRKALVLIPSCGSRVESRLAEFKFHNFEAAIPALRVALAENSKNMQARKTASDSVYRARGNSPDAAKYLAQASAAILPRRIAQRAGAKLPFGEKLRLRDENTPGLQRYARLSRVTHCCW